MNKYLTIVAVATAAMYFAFFANADNAGMRQREQFEYKVVNVVTLLDIKSFEEAFNQALESHILNDPTLEKVKDRNLKIETALNELGKQRWELVNVDKDYNYIFKRKI
jgi:hypothetical protein